jgi:cell division septation protein DedD
MNNTGFDRHGSAPQLVAKGFLIVIVVVFSAVSFTLGYFVGKSGMDSSQKNLPQPAEIIPIPQTQAQGTLPQPGNTATPENTAMAEETDREPGQTQQKEVIVDAPKQAAQAQTVKEKSRSQANSQQAIKEATGKPLTKEIPVSQETVSSTEEPVYTVQMAAFKSSAEAVAFRKKYAEKGIKTFVSTSAPKKKEKVYKVKTGEFRDRKSAEILSLKLNKTEKLRTFVTLKNG